MKEMTSRAIKDALAGESQAYFKYLVYSEVAQKEGYENIAKLFRAIAYAEKVHAGNHARLLGLINKTGENLQAAIDGEDFEVEEMYPAYKAIAELQDEKGSMRMIHYALEAEKIHHKLYQEAKEAADNEQDIDVDEIYICPVCGYTHMGVDLPDNCPVCNVPAARFKQF